MTQAAYDFHEGALRIWVDGEIVATFPPRYFGNLVLALVKQMKDSIRD